MTNEELAVAIQQGHTELYSELWEQVRAFVIRESKRRYRAAGGRAGTIYEYTDAEGMTVADYAQSGFLAVVRAVKYYDSERGSFLTLLGDCLPAEFNVATQWQGSRASHDPIHRHKSLDVPLNADDPDGETLLDMQQNSRNDYEDAEERMFIEALRKALDRAIADLPATQARALTGRYWEGRTLKELCTEERVSIGLIGQREQNGLRSIRRRAKDYGLQQFVDELTSFYCHVGVNEFQRTHTSAVERLAIERERIEKQLREGVHA